MNKTTSQSGFIELVKATALTAPFIGEAQFSVMNECCRGAEGKYFADKFVELAHIVSVMPKTFETEGQGMEAVAHLHYFFAGSDWYITECDRGDGADDRRQAQAFGLAMINSFEPEVGYINIEEILCVGAELDLDWKPKTLSSILGEPANNNTPAL